MTSTQPQARLSVPRVYERRPGGEGVSIRREGEITGNNGSWRAWGEQKQREGKLGERDYENDLGAN